MKIKDRTNLEVMFGELDEGSVFKYENVFYMKTKKPYDSNYNTVELFDGDVETFMDGTYVIVCNCELIIG